MMDALAFGPAGGDRLIDAIMVLCALVPSAMVMCGWLVPRWTYNQVLRERDRWRDDAHSCSQTVLLSQAHQQQLLDRVNELQRERNAHDPATPGG